MQLVSKNSTDLKIFILKVR